MSTFRCRRCLTVVEDPMEHIEVFHQIPSTMAQVWEQFTLVASDKGKRRKHEHDDAVGPLDIPLFG